MDLELDDRRVLVTAGAAGIGLAIADAFLREGARVHVCDVDERALETVREGRPGLTASRCDVADRRQVARLFDDAMTALGGLDCLVNNAGIAGPTAGIQHIEPDDWDRCIAVNLTGQFNCARLAVPHLLAAAGADAAVETGPGGAAGPRGPGTSRRGAGVSMLNVSSLAGRFGFAMRAPYAASKWAVIGFTKSLAIELGSAGIRVNALLPGIVAGDRQRRVLDAKAEARGIDFAVMEALAFSHTSIRDYVPPTELADMVVYLASARARHISGQSVSVCGDTGMLG